jgi:glucose/arabinose dehydrogenase
LFASGFNGTFLLSFLIKIFSMKQLSVLPCLLIALATSFSACQKVRGHYGTKSYDKVERPVSTAGIKLPSGYRISLHTANLNFPTGLTFDDKAQMYVIESGYAYGEIFTTPKLIRVDQEGKLTEIAKGGNNGPWTAVDFHRGFFYVSEGGSMESGKILKISMDGNITVLVDGLPGGGDHHTDAVLVGDDGYIYFGQGTATNSGVVGEDNYQFGWLKRKKDFHDIPCEDIVLEGVNYETKNVLSDNPKNVETGAYVPFGTKTAKGQVIKGSLPCTGAVMRVPLNGGLVELVAWGFRNPFGMAFSPSGALYVTDNSYDTRGSRPVFGAGDLFWEVKSKTWYGWPDYAGEDSVSGENYKARKIQPKSVLLKDPGKVPKPAAVFGVHSSSNGFDFSTSPSFGFEGEAFVAQFGDESPNVGTVYWPVGFKVVRVNPETGNIADFAVNEGKRNGPASFLKNGGLERPVAVKFSPDGKTMYVVDFGVMEHPKEGPAPKQGTGVIWKIVKE